jgi:hypothetical protein
MGNQTIFNSVKIDRPQQNTFDLSHDVKLSCNMGQLVPVCAIPILPGDKLRVGSESLLRFAPMVAPVMHRIDCRIEYFFVPNRIIWDGWEKFITNTKDGGALPAHPAINVTGVNYSKLHDYFGIPKPPLGSDVNINALPFAAYQRIVNEYYRDQNLMPDEPSELQNGINIEPAIWELHYRCWEHDYFTSALPFAQKGDPVELPLGTFNDVEVFVDNGGVIVDPNTVLDGTPNDVTVTYDNANDPGIGANTLYAQTSSLINNAPLINDLRTAIKIQGWLEKQARGGSRYTENTRTQWGVISPDARLQRPEYVGGVKTAVVISEVLNTTGTVDAPQGNMAGHGFGVIQSKNASYYSTEHGWLIGIMSVMPKTAYQDGISKHFQTKSDPFDYPWPDLANLGEEAINNQEVWAYGLDGVFGYTPRYANSKFELNRVAGQFRTTLDTWHLGRKFASAPKLNEDFVVANPDTRIFAVTDPEEDHLYCHVLNKISVKRKLPKYGTPTTF